MGMPTSLSISTARSSASRRDMRRCRRSASVICAPIVCTGLRDVMGSWKIMEISLPRIVRIWETE